MTNKLRIILADETLRHVVDNRHIDRSDRFRIPRGKATRYLYSHHSNGHSDTQSTSRQIKTTRERWGYGDDDAGIKRRNVWE